MKNFKLFLSVSFLLALSFSQSIFAHESGQSLVLEHEKNILVEYDESKMDYLPIAAEDDSITPFAVDACPGRGNHEMRSRGWATLIEVDGSSKTTIFSGGAAWQCKWCNEVLVTEYDPLLHGTTGYYSMRHFDYQIGAYGAIMEATPEMINYTSGTKVPYCRLSYN